MRGCGRDDIGLELASERDATAPLEKVCVAARDLFGASYVTLGIVERNDRTDAWLPWAPTSPRPSRPAIHCPGFLQTVVGGRQTVRGDNPEAIRRGYSSLWATRTFRHF